jgi:hypothetical protein
MLLRALNQNMYSRRYITPTIIVGTTNMSSGLKITLLIMILIFCSHWYRTGTAYSVTNVPNESQNIIV